MHGLPNKFLHTLRFCQRYSPALTGNCFLGASYFRAIVLGWGIAFGVDRFSFYNPVVKMWALFQFTHTYNYGILYYVVCPIGDKRSYFLRCASIFLKAG